MQTIEYAWSERIKDKESKSLGGGKLSLEEQSLFGGLTRAAATMMVCPKLLEHVRSEAEKEGKLQKALRLAKEERETRNSGRPHRGKNNQKKEGDE